MNTKTLNYLILIFTCILINGCQHENYTDLTQDQEGFSQYNFDQYGITPLWDHAIIKQHVIEVPFKRDGKVGKPEISIGSKTISAKESLFLYRDKNKKIKFQYIITYLPTGNYEGTLGDLTLSNFKGKNFDGKIILRKLDANETKINILNVEQGRLLNDISGRVIDHNLAESKKELASRWVEHGYRINWYQWVGGEWDYTGSTTITWKEHVPDDDTRYYEGITDYSVYDDDLGGSGGTDNGDDDDKIIEYLNGKAKCVYDKMVKNKGNINWILENFEDKNGKPSEFNLVLQMSTFLDNKTNASTVKSGKTFYININANTISDRTSLGLARTIIHEGIHARLREFAVREGSNAIDFPGIYEYYRKYGKNWDHQQMADYYKETIAKGLKHFDNAKHNDEFYDALAWEGLANIVDANGIHNEIYTEAWKKLTIAEQNRIKNIIKSEKNTGSKICK